MTELLSTDHEFIRKLTEIVIANLENENFGVKQLVHESGMSHSSLNRRLHEINRTNINHFISHVRLQKALEILQNEKVSASEVAYKVGFSSPAYFNTCFHEFFGYPPGQVEKRVSDTTKEIHDVQVTEKQVEKISVLRTFIFASSGILVLAVLIYLVYNEFFSNSSQNSGLALKDTEKSIAVLPFRNLSDSTANQYFIDGVMEEILTDLSRIHGLRVLSRTSVEQFRGSHQAVSEIAKKLKVEYILEGSGQKYGNSFLLRVQLIEASKDKHIWAESYEQVIMEPKDIFNIQNQIALTIAEELKASITPEEKQLIKKKPTSNLTAYDFYLRGKDEYNKIIWPERKPEILKRAEVLFRKTLAYDSTFAQAYCGLAMVCWKKFEYDNYLVIWRDSMRILADMALYYDNQLAEAYFVKGAFYVFKGNIKQAVSEFNKATSYNPSDWAAYHGKAWIYEDYDLAKAIENYQKVVSLTHGQDLIQDLGFIGYNFYQAGFPEKGNYYFREVLKLDGDSIIYLSNIISNTAQTQGDYIKAIEFFGKRYSEDSTNVLILLRLGYYNSLLGQHKESLKYYKKYVSELKVSELLNTWHKQMMGYPIGYAYIQSGYKKEGEYYLERAIEAYNNLVKFDLPGHQRFWTYRLAAIYAFKGNKTKAYENLEILNKGQCFGLNQVMQMKNDPMFNKIRNEAEFQKIVKDIEAKYKAEHERVSKWLKEQGN